MNIHVFLNIGLSDILKDFTFVGIVDLDRSVSLIQHSTKLFIVNHAALSYVSRCHSSARTMLNMMSVLVCM